MRSCIKQINEAGACQILIWKTASWSTPPRFYYLTRNTFCWCLDFSLKNNFCQHWQQLNEQNAVTIEDWGECSVASIVPTGSYPSVCAYRHTQASMQIYCNLYANLKATKNDRCQKEGPCFSTVFVIHIKTMIEQIILYSVIWWAYFPTG